MDTSEPMETKWWMKNTDGDNDIFLQCKNVR
jgi:hypothetical protein